MLEEEPTGERVDVQQTMKTKDALGVILVFAGMFVAFWVFWRILKIFADPREMMSFQQIVSGSLEGEAPTENGKAKLVIPREILAYVVPLALLLIAAGVAKLLITGGVHLLYGDIQKVMVRVAGLQYALDRKVNDLREKVMRFKDVFKER